MNFLGHAHVAGDRDDTCILGVVLPDLASMAGVRVDRAGATGALADGIALHHRADAAFHADATFVAGTIALRRDLDATGVRPASSRAIAHVGWELLLDGTLSGTAAEAAFWRAIAIADDATVAISAPTRSRWRAFVDRWPARAELRYDDAAWVASRVHAMLARRPRLAFDADDIATVAAVLARHQPGVAAVAPAVLAALRSRVGDGTDREDGQDAATRSA